MADYIRVKRKDGSTYRAKVIKRDGNKVIYAKDTKENREKGLTKDEPSKTSSKKTTITKPSDYKQIADALESSNKAVRKNAEERLKQEGINPNEYDRASLISSLRDAYRENERLKVKQQETQKSQTKRLLDVESKARAEGRSPTIKELMSVKGGGIVGSRDLVRDYEVTRLTQKQEYLKRQKAEEGTRLARSILSVPTINYERDTKGQESITPKQKYVRSLEEQQVLRILPLISTPEQRLEDKKILQGEYKSIDVPSWQKIEYNTSISNDKILGVVTTPKSPRLEYEYKKFGGTLETSYERGSALAAIPLFTMRATKTAFNTLTASFKPSTYKQIPDLLTDIATGGKELMKAGYMYGTEIKRLPYTLPADLTGIYLSSKVATISSKKLGKYINSKRQKVKVEVPQSRQGGVLKEISQSELGTQSKLKSFINSKEAIRIRYTRVPKHLSGRNIEFASVKDIPKGYIYVSNAPNGKIFAQKIIKPTTRYYNVNPQRFRITGEDFRIALQRDGNILSPEKTIPGDFYFNPKTAKYELIKTKPASRVSTFTEFEKSTKFTGQPQTLQIAGVGKIETVKTKFIPEQRINIKFEPVSPFLETFNQPGTEIITGTSKLKPILNVIEPKSPRLVLLPPIKLNKNEVMLSQQNYINKFKIQNKTKIFQEIKPVLEVKQFSDYKIKTRLSTKDILKIDNSLQTKNIQDRKSIQEIKPVLEVKQTQEIKPVLEVKTKFQFRNIYEVPQQKLKLLPPIKIKKNYEDIFKPKKYFNLGGNKQYKPSISGIVSGVSLFKEPKKKQTGIDIRYPIMKKGKKKKDEEDFIFGSRKWLQLGV